MENSNRYNSGGQNQKSLQPTSAGVAGGFQYANSAQQQSRMDSAQSHHQYVSSDSVMQNHYNNTAGGQQQYRQSSQKDASEGAQAQESFNTKHKPQFSQMSVESPKFAANQQQQAQPSGGANMHHQKQRSSGAQHSRGQLSSGANRQRQESSSQSKQNRYNQGHSGNNSKNQHVLSSQTANEQHRAQRSTGDRQGGYQQQKAQGGAHHGQSYSQSRYVSQKNEKDIKHITKVDLRNLKQLDDTIEEEDINQQLRAAQAVSNAQSRSHSYAATCRQDQLKKMEQGDPESDDSEEERKMAANNKRNIPSSTYHQITGEELRYELFFAPRNSNKGGQTEYFNYKEMVQMYQAEIKRRWDQRAQIKERYVFPRVSNKQKSQAHSKESQQSYQRLQSKTPVIMSQLNPKATADSQTPLMDSKGASQNISLIPSEGQVSPTKQQTKQNAQQLAKSLVSKDIHNSKMLNPNQRNQAQAAGSKHVNIKPNSNQLIQTNAQGQHQKNAMSSEHKARSGRGMQGGDHHHTQSAAVVGIVQSSQDLAKINITGYQPNNENIVQLNQNLVPDSKRERRNQQQIQNMMKYNQNSGSTQQIQQQKSPALLNSKAGARHQMHQQSYNLSRNGNLNDLQKPQIMSMQPQNRVKVESQISSYANPLQPSQLHHGVSQQQIQTAGTVNMKGQMGRSATQMSSYANARQGNSNFAVIASHHNQKQSADSLKAGGSQQPQQRHESQKHSKKGAMQHYTHYNKSFVNSSKQPDLTKKSVGTRNTASIISVKSNKSPAINRSHKTPNDIASSKQYIHQHQERTMTQQQVQAMGAVQDNGRQVSQRQTTRSQVKSDQIPQTYTKFKSKAQQNKNSIISLNKHNEMQINDRVSQNEDERPIMLTSNRVTHKKNNQYQNMKTSFENRNHQKLGSLISGGGESSHRKNGAQSTDKVNQISRQNNVGIKEIFDNVQFHPQQDGHPSAMHHGQNISQQHFSRLVNNSTQLQKSHDQNAAALVGTFEKFKDTPKANNSVSPVKQHGIVKHGQGQHHQLQQTTHATVNGGIQGQNADPRTGHHMRHSLTMQKSQVEASKSPHGVRETATVSQVSIFDTSPESMSYENSRKKQEQQNLLNQQNNNFQVPYDQSQGGQIRLSQDQYRTQSALDSHHANSSSQAEFPKYLSHQNNIIQSQSSQLLPKAPFINHNSTMAQQLDRSNTGMGVYQRGTQPFAAPNEMSVVIEAQRETNENLFENEQENLGGGMGVRVGGHQASKTQTMIRRVPSGRMDASENVAPELSHESITFNYQAQDHQGDISQHGQHQLVANAVPDSNKKTVFKLQSDTKSNRGPQIHHKSFKKDSKLIQKSIVTHHQTRSMQSIERPSSNKGQVRSDRQKKHNFHQQQQQNQAIFNEYNDTVDSVNQIKNSRQRSSALNNNNISNFQTDSSVKLQTSSSAKPQKTYAKSSSKQNIPTAQQQLLAQQQNALISNMNQGIGSAPQASRLIQKQMSGQSFTLHNMLGSRNANQGLKNINSMKEQRIAQVTMDQNVGSNLSTLQTHQSQYSMPGDMILNMQKPQQIIQKMPFKHQAQRSQNQQSVIFKPTSIIQTNPNKTHQQSRNPQLINAQSSSLIYGASQGQGLMTSINQSAGDGQMGVPGSQNHQHFHSISSHQDLSSNAQNQNQNSTQYRRQMLRAGSQKNVQNANSNQKSSQSSLITLNMAVNNFQVNQRAVAGDSNNFYGGAGNTTTQNVQQSYAMQSQPKIPKKKRQTNSYSGSLGPNGASQSAVGVSKISSNHTANNLSQMNSYGDNQTILNAQSIPMSQITHLSNHQPTAGQHGHPGAGQSVQYHGGHHSSGLHQGQSGKSSSSAKQRGKNNSSSVHSNNSIKHHGAGGSLGFSHGHQGGGSYSGYHPVTMTAAGSALNNSNNRDNSQHSAKQQNIITASGGQPKIKNANPSIYGGGQQMMHHGASVGVSQMGILRNSQMKPKK